LLFVFYFKIQDLFHSLKKGFTRYSRGLRSLKIFIREYQNPYLSLKQAKID
jgi:hypothetical protein